MNQNVRTFLKAELNMAYQYLDRSFFVVNSNLSIKNNLSLKDNVEKFYQELYDLLSSYFDLNESRQKSTCDDYKRLIKASFELSSHMLDLNLMKETYNDLYKDLFNYYYDKAYFFHMVSLDQKELNIVAPRSHFIIPINNDSQDLEVQKYIINWEIIKELENSKSLFVSSLSDKRNNCYEESVTQGHEYIYKKDYKEALKSFSKARNFKEDAEVLNLIGWTHSFLEELELAQKYALKAIRKDPDYGAAYNDLGSYLLTDGKIDEALEWFKMAKNATNYQNREYPYINSGRAYLLLKDYSSALNEFSYALTLAPYHEELHETVAKLQQTMDRSDTNSKTKIDLNLEENRPIF